MTTIKLSPCQEDALNTFLDFLYDEDQEIMVISGFAGSGKSFLVEYMVDVIDNVLQLNRAIDKEYKAPGVFFTATTNKAVEVLRNMLNKEVQTIHALLGLTVRNDYSTGKQSLEATNPGKDISDAVVFIDESSMINRELMSHIEGERKAAKGCKVVFIGDPYQLPPVMETLCPVFQRTDITHVFLDEIQRQVAGSPIIQLSAKYREVLDDPEQPWPRIQPDGQQIFFYDEESIFRQAIHKSMGGPHDPTQHKVLAWANQRVIDYNHWIRHLQGLTGLYEIDELVMTNKPIMSGRAVMAPTDSLHRIVSVTAEDNMEVSGYLIELEALNAKSRTSHFRIFQPANWHQVNQLLKQLAKDKNWAEYFRIKEDWADLRPIHALTCHKAQGSTYQEVFVDLNDIGRNTRWHEAARLAYVAVTRASERLHIYGNLGACNYPSKQRNQIMEAFKDVDHLVK